jgi:hypothetical protein
MQVFETQQLAALVVEGVAGGGMLRLCEIHVLRSRGSFRNLLERADASLVYVVSDAATCHGNFGAAPVVVVGDGDDGDDTGAVPETSAPLRWLDADEEAVVCGWLRDMCLELMRDMGEGCSTRPLQGGNWQQQRHRELAAHYRRQRGVLLDIVIDALSAQSWLCSFADGNRIAAC